MKKVCGQRLITWRFFQKQAEVRKHPRKSKANRITLQTKGMPTCDATRFTHKEFGVERSGFLVSSQEVVEKAPWLILRAATDTNKPFSEGKRVRGFCLDETTLGAHRWSCEIVSCFGPFLFSKQSYAWVRRRNKWSTPFTSQLPLKQRSKTVIQWNHQTLSLPW